MVAIPFGGMIWSSVRPAAYSITMKSIPPSERMSYGDDARVVERACRLGFLNEALFAVWISNLVRGQNLYGDGTLEMRVACLVDDTHPAFTQLRLDRVAVEECRADHHVSS